MGTIKINKTKWRL